MHNVVLRVLLQMLRIVVAVLCTCVFAPLLLLEYNTPHPKCQPKMFAILKLILVHMLLQRAQQVLQAPTLPRAAAALLPVHAC
jgi:hypothetical protein